MKNIILLAILLVLPICSGLNCYVCSGGVSGCNDPFNSTSSYVTTSSSSVFTYCTKSAILGVVTRAGTAACVEASTVSNTYTKCCQTDLCNGARRQNPVAIVFILSFILALIKFY